jgi:hypothetical protein
MFECCLSNQVYIDVNKAAHSIIDQEIERMCKIERSHSINFYFKQIIQGILDDKPNTQSKDKNEDKYSSHCSDKPITRYRVATLKNNSEANTLATNKAPRF